MFLQHNVMKTLEIFESVLICASAVSCISEFVTLVWGMGAVVR